MLLISCHRSSRHRSPASQRAAAIAGSMVVISMLHNALLSAAMASFKQILANHLWDPKRRLHCAIDLLQNSVIWPVAMMLQSGRIGLSVKRTN